MRLGLALSAAVHAGAAAALLLPWTGGSRLPARAPPIEVELIQASTAGRAAPPTDASAQAEAPAPAAQPAPTAPPPPQRDAEAVPVPPPPAARPAVRPAPAPSAVNLGNGGQDLADLNARSDDVVPPRPDSRFRNLPPAYPAEAMRRRQEGTVRMVVHVSANGIPVVVELAGSSGHPSLDKAALDAVGRWRFNPAMGAAGPVPFDYPLDIHFVGDGR